MLVVGSFVDGGDDAVDDAVDVTTQVAAGSEVVRAASLSSPTGVRELLSETTTTLVEATGATTSTTAAPAPTVPPTTSSTTEVAPAEGHDADAAPDPADAGTATRALSTEATPTTAPPTTAPPTTQAPRPAAPTTTAPAPARQSPPTTAAPAPSGSAGSGGYAYDDPRSTQVWYDLARCESGGNWSIDNGNGYYGGLQFSLGTWESVGGSGYPNEHPAATQIDFGRRLQARQGWGAWPHCSEELGLR